MAVTGLSDNTRKKLEELQKGYQQSAAVTAAQNALAQHQANQPQAYQQSAAVTAAQNELNQHKANNPGEYKASDAVTAALNTMNQIQAQKPQGYTSKYADQLDSIMAQIANPQEFKYEFNGDNLFKSYADLYTQKAKQGMQDAIGAASALTGGYGNSYAQAVGQQQFQQNMLPLYDKGLELRDRAYQAYLDKLGNQKDMYNMLAAADDREYNRYRDIVGDWENERDFATNRYDTERNFDYSQHRDTVGDWQTMLNYLTNQLNNERNFDYGQHRDTVGDWQTMLNYLANQAQYERDFDYNAYNNLLNTMMNQAQFENSDYWRQLQWDAAQMAEEEAPSGGSTPKKTTSPKVSDPIKEGANILSSIVSAVNNTVNNKSNIPWNDTHTRVNEQKKKEKS